MRQPMFIAIAGAIMLAVAGCASEPDATAPSPSPSPAASAAPAGQKPAAQPFATASKPLVAQQKPPAPGAVPGLIQSTNPDERAKQVQASINSDKAKKDPFAGLPPAIPRTPLVSSRTQVPTVSQLPQNSRPNRTGTPLSAPRPPKPSSPFPPISPSATASTPRRSPGTPAGPSIATLPPLPTADLANAVQVTGVVKVGGEVQAIVKAPNEETSRYVRVGQRLSNGQILVKRIDLSGADPVVVLEENGVEVGRAVGEPPTQPQKGANQPAA